MILPSNFDKYVCTLVQKISPRKLDINIAIELATDLVAVGFVAIRNSFFFLDNFSLQIRVEFEIIEFIEENL